MVINFALYVPTQLTIGVNATFAMPHWLDSDGIHYSRPVQHAKNTL